MTSAKDASEVPLSVPVTVLNGQTKKKRFKCTIIDEDKDDPKLILETRS